MVKEKIEVITVMMFIYNELWVELDLKNKDSKADAPTRPLSKLLKQIKLRINKLPEEVYSSIRDTIAVAKTKSIDEVVKAQEGSYIASKEDILEMFWNGISRNPYCEMWVRENTVVKAINSVSEYHNNDNHLEYVNNSRKLVKSFMDNLGIRYNNGLATRKKIQEQNIIIERG